MTSIIISSSYFIMRFCSNNSINEVSWCYASTFQKEEKTLHQFSKLFMPDILSVPATPLGIQTIYTCQKMPRCTELVTRRDVPRRTASKGQQDQPHTLNLQQHLDEISYRPTGSLYNHEENGEVNCKFRRCHDYPFNTEISPLLEPFPA
jgi:hypothetical protein